MPLTAKEWYDLHATEYDASYEGMRWVEIYSHITWEKTIKPYLPSIKEGEILDAGGGTGVWTIPLAELGYRVTLTDISENMLEIAREKLTRRNLLAKVRIVVADVVKMDMFRDESFDFVLCEGDPLSYRSDPPKGITELVRVAKAGGVIVASVDNLYSLVRYCLREGHMDRLTTLLESQWEKGGGGSLVSEFPVYYFRPEELIQRFEEAGCGIEKIVGKNMFTGGLGDRLKDSETFETVQRLELKYCDSPHLVGYAGHIAVVCRKKGSTKPYRANKDDSDEDR